MAVYFPAISIYTVGKCYPMLPFKVAVRRLSTVKLRCLGFDGGGDDVTQYVIESRKHWDNFYERHQNKFFKDRHYLEKDWGQYFCDEDDTPPTSGKIILEAGCGTGNTIFPIAKKYPKLFVHACDFSHHAITLVKSHTNFREDQMNGACLLLGSNGVSSGSGVKVVEWRENGESGVVDSWRENR
nr:methyltransferase-like protein 6 [Tanacetum cinerariifolium]